MPFCLRTVKFLFIISALVNFTSAFSQTQILAFKFASTDNGRQPTFNSTSTNTNLEISTLSRGAGALANASSTSTFTAVFPQSANKNAAILSNSYFEFFVKAKAGFFVSLSELNITLRRQSTSAFIYGWRYSVDGGTTFKDIGNQDISISSLDNNGTIQPALDLSAYSELQNVPSSLNIIFRIYAWGGNSSDVLTSAFSIGKNTGSTNSISVSGLLSNIDVPGEILGYKKGTNGVYLGSPSICVLPNGDYIASNDFFGPSSDARINGESVTRIYASKDRGATWQSITDLIGQFMSNVFVFNNDLYILGVSGNNGNIVIRKSTDNGLTWTTPTDGTNGVLKTGNFHTAPTPVVVHNGRIYRAMEDTDGDIQSWPRWFRAFMMSAPVSSDLLQASNWTFTNTLPYNPTYLNGFFVGWLEGNAVVGKDNVMRNILRVHTFSKRTERMAVTRVINDGRLAVVNNDGGIRDFPGGGKKFTIRYDATSDKYWTLTNYVPPIDTGKTSLDRVRNTLALASSDDLFTWNVNAILLNHPDSLFHGFQYVDWQFDGNDMIAVSRTAYDDGNGGANTYHNNNFITYHRFPNFRTLQTLPILFSTFSAKRSGSVVNLTWQTDGKNKNLTTKILRYGDDKKVEVLKTLNNLSENKTDFNYTDFNPLKGVNYYQLTETNENGKSQSSSVIAVNFDESNQGFSISKNDKAHTLNLEVTATVSGNSTLTILDIEGKIIAKNTLVIKKGTQSYMVQLNQSGGIAIAIMEFPNGEKLTKKFYNN